ncbi:hypothetical protein SSX86_032459 [Deinandra increscens subsp. villosa]|uniref:Bulb-type lectin domain-containing protein n=1 Tax=Deinandra increscens subsp. villosa TaxID=3103831 RepID=A0AAP0C464_9ASTR
MAAYSSVVSSILFFFFFLFLRSDAIVPANETFHYVNEGDFGTFDSEYAPTYRPLPPFTFPFQLCFYNTTPNAYTLALRMGTRRDGTVMPWVWEANRGKPVSENATFSLLSDGNLVLADANGQIAWQTDTANKGVVGFAILSDGNVVLRDSKGNFVWQSFDSPTDTLLVGQTLSVRGGPLKLVSRESITNNVNGVYSLLPKVNTKRTTFTHSGVTFKTAKLFEFPDLGLGQVRYNSSLSYLRLGIDGNLRLYTYRANVRGNAWSLLFTLFDRREDEFRMDFEDECQLPNRCGKFGLCEDSQCVGCPKPDGVLAWSKDCDTKSPGCEASGFKYYELKGVDHFTVKYTGGNGPMKRSECESKCTKDCKCMGYFYRTDKSRCWIAYELKTLTRVGNSTHFAYIKTPIS